MENLKKQLEQIGREMSARRHLIPQQNRRKYDIEAKDYFNALNAAAEKGDVKRFNQLKDRWADRELMLTIIPHCYLAPPALVRRDNETPEDYLNRCYQAHKELK